jgi:hypothetical protein
LAKSKILEATATTTPQRFSFVLFDKIQYLANDSEDYDLKINFDGDIDEAGTRTIKAYEVIDDIPMDCSYFSIQSIGGDVPFRISGI